MTRGAESQESCSPGDRLHGSGWGCTWGGGVSPRKRGSWGHTAEASGSATAGRGGGRKAPASGGELEGAYYIKSY